MTAPYGSRKAEFQRVHKAHPDWNALQIAAHMGISPENVRQLASRYKLRLPRVVRKRDPLVHADRLERQGRALIAKAEEIRKEVKG